MPGIVFRNTPLVRPQAVSYADDSALATVGGSSNATVGIVGVAERGQPNVAALWTDPAAAAAYYGNGGLTTPLIDGIRRCFDGGASRVVGVRVGDAIQATALLKKSSTTLLTVTTKEWGVPANTWSIKVAAGTTSGKKVTLTIDGVGTTYAVDNITRGGFTLQYAGATTTPTVSVTATQLSTAVGGTPATGDVNTFAFATYATLQQLVNALNNTTSGQWSAVLDHPDGGDVLCTTLDLQTALTVPTTVSGTFAYLTTNIWAMADTLNGSQLGGLVAAAVNSTDGPIDNATTAFTGATDTVVSSGVTSQHFTDGMAVLQNADTALVCVMSATAAVHASLKTHCTTMSDTAGLAHDRVVYVGDAPKDPNVSGVLTTWPAYYLAATIAGMEAGKRSVGDALTRQFVPITGIERAHTGPEIDTLLLGGVLPMEYVDGRGYRVAQSITTSRSNNLVRRELSVRRGADYISRSVRDALDEATIGRTGVWSRRAWR